MGAKSQIEWTEATWNPVTGCTRVSRGCDNCYAATLSKRLEAMGHDKYAGLINNGKTHFNGIVKLHSDTLSVPTSRRKPTVYFVNSMSDLFHREVPVEFIADIFEVMTLCPQHVFQILTKRPARMAELMPTIYGILSERLGRHREHVGAPLPNVWLGTSVEDQSAADSRIPALSRTTAAIRFLSCEPLLGPIHSLSLGNIDWVIVGGESGPGARKMEREWVVDIRRRCEDDDVAFFFKQWGGVNKKSAGRTLDGRTWDAMPEVWRWLSEEEKERVSVKLNRLSERVVQNGENSYKQYIDQQRAMLDFGWLWRPAISQLEQLFDRYEIA